MIVGVAGGGVGFGVVVGGRGGDSARHLLVSRCLRCSLSLAMSCSRLRRGDIVGGVTAVGWVGAGFVVVVAGVLVVVVLAEVIIV